MITFATVSVLLFLLAIVLTVSVTPPEEPSLTYWTALYIPVIALAFAALEIEIEGGYQWATRIPTRTVFGGATAYHVCLGATVLLIAHLPWLDRVSDETPTMMWDRERVILARVVLIFLFEDIMWHLINPPVGCEVLLTAKDCMRDFKRSALRRYEGSRIPVMYPALVALAVLLCPEWATWINIALQLAVVILVGLVLPGALIRASYVSRRASAKAKSAAGLVKALGAYSGDTRALMEALSAR